MEDLWKLKDVGYRVPDLADRAEYNRLVQRFREEEVRSNTRNLLFGNAHIPHPDGKEHP